MDRITDETHRANTKNDEVLRRSWERWERGQKERADTIWAASMALFAVLFAFGVGSGCEKAEKAYYVTYATTVQAVNGAYRALDRYDEGKIKQILALPIDEGRVEFVVYDAQVKIARKVLATATDTLDVTNSGSRLYKRVAAKDYIGALGELGAIVLAVRDALHVFGVEVP